MKRRTLIILATIAIVVTILVVFWKPILLEISGYTPPKAETPEDIASYAKGKDYEVLAISNSEESFNLLNQDFGVPGVIFFNNKLQPIESSKGVGCPKEAKSFIDEISSGKEFGLDTTSFHFKSFNELLGRMKVIEGDSLLLSKQLAEGDFDYVIVYTWAKILKKQSQAMMKIGTDALKKKGLKILVLSLNLDFSTLWMEPENIKVDFE
jgi:hypothetical protein